jgi:hypothetical protein
MEHQILSSAPGPGVYLQMTCLRAMSQKSNEEYTVSIMATYPCRVQ